MTDKKEEYVLLRWQVKLDIAYKLISTGSEGAFLSEDQKAALQNIMKAIILAERSFVV